MKYFTSLFNRKGLPVADCVSSSQYMQVPIERVLYMVMRVFILSVSCGIVAVGALLLVRLMSNVLYFNEWSVAPVSPIYHNLDITAIILPVAGVLAGVLLLRKWKFLSPLSSVLNIGSGIPLGPEGVAMNFGVLIGKHHELLITAGVAAGFAGMFGTPFAAIILVSELLYKKFILHRIGFIGLAALTGAAIHMLYFGMGPFFVLPAGSFPSPAAIGLYALIGVITGLSAALLVFVVQQLRSFAKGWAWPVASALAVGVAGMYAPEILGNGIEQTAMMLQGKVTLSLLISFSMIKFILILFVLGTRTNGGIVLPIISIGAALGILIALLIQLVFPGTPLNPPLAAMVGMAALFAGVTRGWLTAIVFALECTWQGEGILPLLFACTISWMISGWMMKKEAPLI
ncbi:chloride channel protein [Chitinophaga sp. SYP-B3965]|uniref:chloride channel protein n=1 Tax=Chitinophaga sp. SYP-B3965 TaxID=2663120 RepID=UPI0015631C66|nr:chloride channel protein [Chitinophaga sp. SYP-B3965]